MNYEPLTPLTGDPTEWQPIAEQQMGRPGVEQNVRCGRVFRENGQVYALDCIVWTERGGGGFTGHDSHRVIELPCLPPEPRRIWHRLRRPVTAWARLTGTLPR